MNDLRKLDEEIATMRGWGRVKRTSGILLPGDAWIAPTCDRGWHGARWVDCNGAQVLGYLGHEPPPFSSSWALAGPLIEEAGVSLVVQWPHGRVEYYAGHLGGYLNDDRAWDARPFEIPMIPMGEGATPCEAIARAWVAWRRGRA